MFLFILTILCFHVFSYEFSYSSNNFLLNHHFYFQNYNRLIYCPEKISLFSSYEHSLIKENLLKLKCHDKNLKYQSITYDDFIFEKYNKRYDILYINDFLINYGRIIHEKEKEYLLEYNEYPKLILNIEESVNLVIKDNYFLDKLNKINFEVPSKKIMNQFIYYLIEYYNYDNHLHSICWSKYNLEKYSFENLENLIFKIHLAYQYNKNIDQDYLENLIINH